MQISWTNNDYIDHVLWIKHKNEQGVVTETGGTDLLKAGTTFSMFQLQRCHLASILMIAQRIARILERSW